MFLRNVSIRIKLNVLTMVASTCALILACTALAVHDLHQIRMSKIANMTSIATLLGQNSTAALEFMDQETATQLLSSFSGQPNVERASLLDADGAVFASYSARSALSPDDEFEAAKKMHGDVSATVGRYPECR